MPILIYVGHEGCHYLFYLCFLFWCGESRFEKVNLRAQADTVAEWLRRLTRNQLDLFRVGSSPTGVVIVYFWRGCNGKFSKIKYVGASLHTQCPWLYLLIVPILIYVGHEGCHYLFYLCFLFWCGESRFEKVNLRAQADTVAEWLRRLTRNQLDLFRVGSSPTGVVIVHFCRGCNGKFSKIKISENNVSFSSNICILLLMLWKKSLRKKSTGNLSVLHTTSDWRFS